MRFKSTYIVVILLVFQGIQFLKAQSRFGFEIKVGTFKTENSGQIIGGGHYYFIPREDDLITWSYSLGLTYKLNERNLFKLHLGRHQNGRKVDAVIHDDGLGGPTHTYSSVDMAFYYYQIAPSYSYRIVNKKFIIPLELGININKQIKEEDVFLVRINMYNFDYEISSGLQYKIMDRILIGVQGVFTGNINEYQDSEYVKGTYEPKLFGIEFSASYVVDKK